MYDINGKYRCPQRCKRGEGYYNLQFCYSQSSNDEIILECDRCGIQIIFKRVPGLYKTVTKRERHLFKNE